MCPWREVSIEWEIVDGTGYVAGGQADIKTQTNLLEGAGGERGTVGENVPCIDHLPVRPVLGKTGAVGSAYACRIIDVEQATLREE